MQHEHRGAATADAEGARGRAISTGGTTAGGLAASDVAARPSPADAAEGVPSEQLWRAAIRAAREAAVLAAELRRQIAASAPPRDVA
jgi:hypothetical protein